MSPGTATRVIVGVSDSLAGLAALRRAVDQARRLEARLHAVRVLPIPAGARRLTGYDWRETEYEGQAYIRRAFEAALGGTPPDLTVEMVTLLGRPARVLADYAYQDTDLLVVGLDTHRPLRRLFRRPVARACLARAACPVLAVPPQELARSRSTRALARQLRREVRREVERSGHSRLTT